jgi:phytoene synthase
MISVADSYFYAEKLTRAEARNFIYTFRLLPPERRRSIFAVYAFSRRADDAVDAAEDGSVTADRARADLAGLRSLLGEPLPDDPLAPALLDTRERFAIPREPFEDLLLGMEMDLVKSRYATFEELSLYCYRAASAIGLIAIEIFGHQGPATREPAIQLGIAMQLTNILRDVLEDRARGRIYLPAEDMERFGYSEEDLLRGLLNDRFRALMRFEVERARAHFQAAEPLFPLIHAESRFCPILLKRLYSRILDRIEAQDYDVIRRRPRLPWHEKIRIAGATWLEARRCRAAAAGGPVTSRRT